MGVHLNNIPSIKSSNNNLYACSQDLLPLLMQIYLFLHSGQACFLSIWMGLQEEEPIKRLGIKHSRVSKSSYLRFTSQLWKSISLNFLQLRGQAKTSRLPKSSYLRFTSQLWRSVSINFLQLRGREKTYMHLIKIFCLCLCKYIFLSMKDETISAPAYFYYERVHKLFYNSSCKLLQFQSFKAIIWPPCNRLHKVAMRKCIYISNCTISFDKCNKLVFQLQEVLQILKNNPLKSNCHLLIFVCRLPFTHKFSQVSFIIVFWVQRIRPKNPNQYCICPIY